MSGDQAPVTGPDFEAGIDIAGIGDGEILAGHVGCEAVLLIRRGDAFFAVGAECTHYHGPLADGLVVGNELRCPWHHAAFSLDTGEAVRAPALASLACWRTERVGDKVYAREGRKPVERKPADRKQAPAGAPASVLILGGGAAGNAAAETLRREGYAGPVTLLSADAFGPYDRPNLSKDYLGGTAPEDWLPLRSEDFYREQGITLKLGARAVAIAPAEKQVTLEDGTKLDYGALLIATGADPVHPPIPGAELPHVHYLRSLSDSRALVAAAEATRRAVVIGASFIGLEVAASLRARGIEVHVVAPETVPMARVLGPEIGGFVQSLHAGQGVHFHLGTGVTAIEPGQVRLADGGIVEAGLVVIGVGVRPALALAEAAGLVIDRGIAVDEYLETSVKGIFAAGDVARWPDPHSGERIRVEHWVVAGRQGRNAALNILGRRERFDAVPFFWSQHYDTVIAYVGHAESFDRTEVAGSIEDRDCEIAYFKGDRKLAVATIFRDRDSLRAEAAFERMLAG